MLMAMPILFAVTVIPMAVASYFRRRRIREDEGEAPKLDGLKPMIPLMIGLMVTPTMIFVPGIGYLDRPVRLAVFLAPAVICLLISVYLGMRQSKVSKTALKPGDLWHDETMQIAYKAGAKVKHVVVLLDEEIVNAFASPLGTVGLTKGLIDKLEPDEVRAVIAHEIGHHRHKHPVRNLILSLCVLGAILALQFYCMPLLKPVLSKDLYELLSGPLIFMPLAFLGPLLLLNPGRRKAELEADRFAVEYMGDSEVVISALTKMHNINLMPHSLRTSDELLSTHPSLVNRIKSIKEIGANR